ncbi:C1 family peptidase [Streptomyces sp. NPDC020800]|uniref:C1 family peptidase n=1 Tax=Streptomyces sp. NPDC020800 TaxID=3365092 RepID=UPI0037B943BF
MPHSVLSAALAVLAAGAGTLASPPTSYAAVPHPAATDGPYGLGALLPTHKHTEPSATTAVLPQLRAIAPHRSGGTGALAAPAAGKKGLPASVDLTPYAASPGNQGQVQSCVSWAIGYSAYSIVEHEQGISGGPQAPMYTHSQIAQGHDTGTQPSRVFSIAELQGIDSRSHYWQGDFDYTTQPTADEQANAAHWKLSGHVPLHTGSDIKNDVKNALANGEPVVISIPVYESFGRVTAQQARSYSYYPASGESYLGGHEVTIVGYDSQGVRVENSWGTNWGDSGFINFSWAYLSNQVEEANAVGGLIK